MRQDQFKGLVPHLGECELLVLQFADDAILFMEDNLEQGKNLKLVLCTFEKLLGLKINFHNSELFCFGKAKEKVNGYAVLFGCKKGSLPFRYLDIPMSLRIKYRLAKCCILYKPKKCGRIGYH